MIRLKPRFSCIPDPLAKASGKLSETGKTGMEFIRDLRLEKARDMLLNTFMLCKEICIAVGFSDPVIFSRIFKKKYGITPQVFRENHDQK